ncbi:MAG: sigma-70 family RNA polymerase sigma factor [Planctomycetota bacterium]|nr:sigma-70 family RNA polymerase sigma factor [Planctomycetota bacterium]
MAMAGKPIGAAAARELERLFEGGTALGRGEPRLLEQFAEVGDEAAFAALVARHGPMVLAVCRRELADPADADDAFQATFLVLARRAGTLASRPTVGPWLREVARRVARKARIQSYKRASKLDSTTNLDTLIGPDSASALDGRWAFEDELSRLPERYRTVLWLCYAEGLSHEEAAARLGCPLGTVKGRLARARDLVRTRLERRGVTASNAFEAFFLAVRVAPQVPSRLYEATIKAAVKVAAGCSIAGATSGTITILVQEGLSMMAMTQLKLAAGGTIAGAMLVAGTVLAGQTAGPDAKPRDNQAPRIALAQAAVKAQRVPADVAKGFTKQAPPASKEQAAPAVQPPTVTQFAVEMKTDLAAIELALGQVTAGLEGFGDVMKAGMQLMEETPDPRERARQRKLLHTMVRSRLKRIGQDVQDAQEMLDRAFAESDAGAEVPPRDAQVEQLPQPPSAAPKQVEQPAAKTLAPPEADHAATEKSNRIGSAYHNYRTIIKNFTDEKSYLVEGPIRYSNELYDVEMKYAGSKRERVAAAMGRYSRVQLIQSQINDLLSRGEAPQSASDQVDEALKIANEALQRARDSTDGKGATAK